MKVCTLALLAWLAFALRPLSTSAQGPDYIVCKNRRTHHATVRHSCRPSEISTGVLFFNFCPHCLSSGFGCLDLGPGHEICGIKGDIADVRYFRVPRICRKGERAIAHCSGLFSGACTTTGDACATNADCSGGSCVVPPGGCILIQSRCDPSGSNACPSGQFCQQIPNAFPGAGFCDEVTGPCRSTVDCPLGEICNPTTPP
jgi:hypothetical protein